MIKEIAGAALGTAVNFTVVIATVPVCSTTNDAAAPSSARFVSSTVLPRPPSPTSLKERSSGSPQPNALISKFGRIPFDDSRVFTIDEGTLEAKAGAGDLDT